MDSSRISRTSQASHETCVICNRSKPVNRLQSHHTETHRYFVCLEGLCSLRINPSPPTPSSQNERNIQDDEHDHTTQLLRQTGERIDIVPTARSLLSLIWNGKGRKPQRKHGYCIIEEARF